MKNTMPLEFNKISINDDVAVINEKLGTVGYREWSDDRIRQHLSELGYELTHYRVEDGRLVHI